mgnify:CR=1 FL=1
MTQHLYRYTEGGWVFCNHEKRTMMEGAGYNRLDLTIRHRGLDWPNRLSVEKWLRSEMDFKLPGEFFE